MGWWPFGRRRRDWAQPRDYCQEGLELADQQKYHEALTSFRLALRQQPDDAEIMQQMALVYTRIGMLDEARRFYEKALEADPTAVGAHYGLAFILLRNGDPEGARAHLEAFLIRPPEGEDVEAHVEHARKTLRQLDAEDAGASEGSGTSEGSESPGTSGTSGGSGTSEGSGPPGTSGSRGGPGGSAAESRSDGER